MTWEWDHCEPAPKSTVGTYRAIGYGFTDAVADILDNSIAAHATKVDIQRGLIDDQPYLAIIDNGNGMTSDELFEAMRPGSRSPKEERLDPQDLGRFTLGLKTASFSQAKQLTVSSRAKGDKWYTRSWDLDVVEDTNEWRLRRGAPNAVEGMLAALRKGTNGTIVLWTHIDRLGSQRKGRGLIDVLDDHLDDLEPVLGLTFHRFMEDQEKPLTIRVGGTKIKPLNPFVPGIDETDMPRERIAWPADATKHIDVVSHVLPPPAMMPDATVKRLARGRGLTNTQGFYIYRNRRLIVAGAWLTRKLRRDLASQLVRIQVDLPSSLDEAWQIDVRKASATIPVAVRDRLIRIAQRAREISSASLNLRKPASTEPKKPLLWETNLLSDGRISFLIDKKNPAIAAAVKDGLDGPDFKQLLDRIEKELPIQKVHA